MVMSRRSGVGIATVAALIMLVLTLRGHSLSAQQQQYSVRFSDTAAPTDPDDAAWNDVPSVEIPLIPQSGVNPALLEASVSSVSVQAVHDGERISFRVAWDDPTRDVEAGRPDVFRDAAAIQFPVTDAVPSICMGAAGQVSNIWHWKADWQEDIDSGFQDITTLYPNFFKDYYPYAEGTPPFEFPRDFNNPNAQAYSPGWVAGNSMSQADRTSPVENLTAIGFGTLTTHEQASIEGRGVWDSDRWSVVFTRELNPAAGDLAGFTAGSDVTTAFAVWNGSNEEVGARKQLSSFVTFGLEPSAEAPTDEPANPQLPSDGDSSTMLIIVLLAAFVIGITIASTVVSRGRPADSSDGGARE